MCIRDSTQLNFGTGGLRELILDGQGNIRTAVSSSEINFNLELNIWATGQAYLAGELVRGSNNGIYQAVVNVNSGAGNNTANPVDATDESIWRRLGGSSTEPSTISVDGSPVTDPNFQDTSGDRGIQFTATGSNITAVANSDSAKQDNLCLLYTSPSPRDS